MVLNGRPNVNYKCHLVILSIKVRGFKTSLLFFCLPTIQNFFFSKGKIIPIEYDSCYSRCCSLKWIYHYFIGISHSFILLGMSCLISSSKPTASFKFLYLFLQPTKYLLSCRTQSTYCNLRNVTLYHFLLSLFWQE